MFRNSAFLSSGLKIIFVRIFGLRKRPEQFDLGICCVTSARSVFRSKKVHASRASSNQTLPGPMAAAKKSCVVFFCWPQATHRPVGRVPSS